MSIPNDTNEPVTIYSTPGCAACFATKRALDKQGIAYEEVDLSERPDLVARFRQEQMRSAPVVEAGDQKWAGYHPEKIRELAQNNDQMTQPPQAMRAPSAGQGRGQAPTL